jgi:hypothetical protein
VELEFYAVGNVLFCGPCWKHDGSLLKMRCIFKICSWNLQLARRFWKYTEAILGYAVGTCGWDMRLEYAAGTCSRNMQLDYAVGTYRLALCAFWNHQMAVPAVVVDNQLIRVPAKLIQCQFA